MHVLIFGIGGIVSVHDRDIRIALRDELKRAHEPEPDTLILDELGLCQGVSRVDMAVVNGAITGYEIKSPRDTLERLPLQQEVYSKTLDRVLIVAGEAHLSHVYDLVPDWWGISVPYFGDNGDVMFQVEREPKDNPQVDPYSLVQLLWRDEALEELSLRRLERGVKSKPRALVWERLAESIDIDELGEIVRRRLKNRSNWRSD